MVLLVVMVLIQAETLVGEVDKELLFLQHSKILPTHMEEQDALDNQQ